MRFGFLLIAVSISVLGIPQMVAQTFPVTTFTTTPRGPDGTARAHVGDTITNVIRLVNTDDWGDSLTITNISGAIYHASGTVFTSNLLLTLQTSGDAGRSKAENPSVVLTNFGDSVRVTNTYTVLPGDGPMLGNEAFAGGIDNHDGPGGTHIPQQFFVSFPGQVRIFAPALRLFQTCLIQATTEGSKVITHGTVSNAGMFDTVLSNVSLRSDNGTSGNTNDDWTFAIGPLTNRQVVAFSNMFALPINWSTNIMVACGTDALGLTVYDTNHFSIPPIALRGRLLSNGTMELKLIAASGFSYRLETSTDLDSWTPGPLASNATGVVTFFDAFITNALQKFYRGARK